MLSQQALVLPRGRHAYQPRPHYNNLLQIAITRIPFERLPSDLARHLSYSPSIECIQKDPSIGKYIPTQLKKYIAKYLALVSNMDLGKDKDPKLVKKAIRYS